MDRLENVLLIKKDTKPKTKYRTFKGNAPCSTDSQCETVMCAQILVCHYLLDLDLEHGVEV